MKNLTFDVRYDNELAHEYYGEGEKIAKTIRGLYSDKNLTILDDFDSTYTSPPIHFMQVSAPDDVDIDGLKNVHIPPGLSIDILDFDD